MLPNFHITKHQYWPLLTIGGIFLFVLFYFIAANYYPGGSNFNQKESGFHWATNYWCELLGRNAKNGQKNIARPYGLTGMIFLFIAVSIFWIKLPKIIPMNIILQRTLQITGVLSMFCAIFIYSYYHDLFIYFSVFFGTIAFSVSSYGFYQNKYKIYLWMCVSALLLIFINNIIYVSGVFINYLPIIQKLTFAFVLFWIIIVSLNYYKTIEKIKDVE